MPSRLLICSALRGACQNATMAQLDEVYANLWTTHGDEFAALDRSLGPQSWTFLFDVAGATDLGSRSIRLSRIALDGKPASTVRDYHYTIEFSTRSARGPRLIW